MTLLSLSKIRYEFQQVSTPVDVNSEGPTKQPNIFKEDFLDVPEDPSNLTRMRHLSGRSIYIGNREAFFA